MHTVKYALEELMRVMDRTDATVIMAEVLGVNRAWIAANPMRILTETRTRRSRRWPRSAPWAARWPTS
jgi:hypothetical protein